VADDATRFLRVLLPAVREAAAIARSLEGRVKNRPKSGETTAVKQALTTADTEAQEALLLALREHFPGVQLAAEEDTPSVSFFGEGGEALVVIDPIDGTLRSYLGGDGPYAVLIGLATRQHYDAALVALPREELIFDALRGGGAHFAHRQGARRPAVVSADGDRVLVSHGMPEVVCARLRAQGLEVGMASGGAVGLAPLIPGVRAGLRYAAGPGGVSIRGRISLLVAREAGLELRGAGHESFPDDLETPAPILRVATSDADFEVLREALSAADLAS